MIVTLQVYGDKIKTLFFPICANFPLLYYAVPNTGSYVTNCTLFAAPSATVVFPYQYVF
jgi:hypothetical protein